jgi:hypothetical protein
MASGTPTLPGIPGAGPEPPQRGAWPWIRMAFAVVLVGLFALIALGLITLAVDAHGPRSSSRAGDIVVLALMLGCLFASTRFAIHAEHQLRRRQPTAQAWELTTASAAPTSAGPPATRRGTRRRRRRQYGPVAISIFLALFALGTVGCIAGAIAFYNQTERSSYTQDHGTRAQATVVYVDNTQSCGRYSCTWSAAITVSLSAPADGVSATVVHYPGYSNLSDGQQITVLVDPKQPDYAEVPGHAFAAAWSWITFVLLGIACGWLTYLDARRLRVLLAHRRTVRAQAALGPPTPAP